MMRIAVAGGGGLGYMLATELSQAANAYNVVVLSRSMRPEFSVFDIQVHVVDYKDPASLGFALKGIDLVISTIPGVEQINLINAAGNGRVRYFVPSEFEGSLKHRRPESDVVDRGSSEARDLLKQWADSSRMRYTVFSCGLFMERFHPYGLGSLHIGYASVTSESGNLLVDANNATAEYVEQNTKGETVRVCLTSVYDVVRLVIAAVDLGPSTWPREFTMRGDRMSVRDLIGKCSLVQNVAYSHQTRNPAEVQTYLDHYLQDGDWERAAYYHRLLATTNGRYDFSGVSLHDAIRRSDNANLRLITFEEWLVSIWRQT